MSVWPHLMQDQPVASNPLSYQLPSVARAQQSVANSSASPAVLGKMEDSRLGIQCDSHFPWGSSYEVIGWRVKWEGVPAVPTSERASMCCFLRLGMAVWDDLEIENLIVMRDVLPVTIGWKSACHTSLRL